MGQVGRFEYPDLKLGEVIGYAQKISQDYGGKISASNLAKIFGIEPRGQGFQNRVEDLRFYDLIEGQREFKLSILGQRLAANPEDTEARAQAFLKVPLFKAMHDEFRGKPPDDNSAFILRLKDITKAEEKAVSIRAARLRGHYNEALPYLMPDIFPVKGEVAMSTKTSATTEYAPRPQSAGILTIPSDYEKLVSDHFIVGTRRDLESIEMLEDQIKSWIIHLKKQFGVPQRKKSGAVEEPSRDDSYQHPRIRGPTLWSPQASASLWVATSTCSGPSF